jgi:hypothetical protein
MYASLDLHLDSAPCAHQNNVGDLMILSCPPSILNCRHPWPSQGHDPTMEYLRKVKSGEVKFSRSFEGLFLSLLLSLLRVFLLSFFNVEMIFA